MEEAFIFLFLLISLFHDNKSPERKGKRLPPATSEKEYVAGKISNEELSRENSSSLLEKSSSFSSSHYLILVLAVDNSLSFFITTAKSRIKEMKEKGFLPSASKNKKDERWKYMTFVPPFNLEGSHLFSVEDINFPFIAFFLSKRWKINDETAGSFPRLLTGGRVVDSKTNASFLLNSR